jgi:hypothetical protein
MGWAWSSSKGGTGAADPGEAGQEELEAVAVGQQAGNRDRDWPGCAELQGADLYYIRKFGVWSFPWMTEPTLRRRVR